MAQNDLNKTWSPNEAEVAWWYRVAWPISSRCYQVHGGSCAGYHASDHRNALSRQSNFRRTMWSTQRAVDFRAPSKTLQLRRVLTTICLQTYGHSKHRNFRPENAKYFSRWVSHKECLTMRVSLKILVKSLEESFSSIWHNEFPMETFHREMHLKVSLKLYSGCRRVSNRF